MFKKLHLCYYELSPAMRTEIKKHLINNYRCVLKDNNYKKITNYTDEEIEDKIKNIDFDKLFELNNAGIDIWAFAYLIE